MVMVMVMMIVMMMVKVIEMRGVISKTERRRGNT